MISDLVCSSICSYCNESIIVRSKIYNSLEISVRDGSIKLLSWAIGGNKRHAFSHQVSCFLAYPMGERGRFRED